MRHGANIVNRIIITSHWHVVHVFHDFGYSHTHINHGLCCASPGICPIRLRAPVITVPCRVEYYPRMYYCPNMFTMFEAISCASVMLQLSNLLLRLALRPDLSLPSAARRETSRIPVANFEFCVPPARNNGRESPRQVWNDHRNKCYAVPSILDEVYEQKELLRRREHDPEIALQRAVCHRGWAHLGSLIIKVCIRTGYWGINYGRKRSPNN